MKAVQLDQASMQNLMSFSFHSEFARKEKWKMWLNVQPQRFYQHWKEMIVELRKYIYRKRVQIGIYWNKVFKNGPNEICGKEPLK